jgi:hypothetical protein
VLPESANETQAMSAASLFERASSLLQPACRSQKFFTNRLLDLWMVTSPLNGIVSVTCVSIHKSSTSFLAI